MKKALITGISGQDGAYLARFLLAKGYQVHGIVRRVAIENPDYRLNRLKQIKDKIILHGASIENYASVFNVVEKVRPEECYHLAAQSFVNYSYEDAFSTFDININGTLNMLSAIKEKAPQCKFFFAGSSEMFGKVKETPQNENSPFYPRSPYGISKVAGFDLTRNFRDSYGLFACSGILFNHESPIRGYEFVTRKITRAAVNIKKGIQKELRLGSLDSMRDWGFAGDYVEAMWLMLQHKQPEDFVVATNEAHSVKEFTEIAFTYLGLKSEEYIVIDKAYCRPVEENLLKGDYTKASQILGWKPKMNFTDLVRYMVDFDLKEATS